MTFSMLIAFIGFYLIGSFPTGKLLAISQGVDLEKQGSGNVGATNVARVMGKKAGISTLLLDVAKGALAVALAQYCFFIEWLSAAAGLAAVAGHCFSIPGFLRGGKGVATALGVILALAPYTALAALVVFLCVFAIWRIVSMASIAAALMIPIIALILGASNRTCLCLVGITFIVVYRHKENLNRLVQGTEKSFRAKS